MEEYVPEAALDMSNTPRNIQYLRKRSHIWFSTFAANLLSDLSDLVKARLNGHVARVMLKGEAGAADLVKWLRGQTARETATSIN